MPIEWPTLIESGIPILGGLYATALGYGVLRASQSLPSPRLQKSLDLFKWLGPAVVLFGVFTGWQAHLHAAHPPAEEVVREINRRLKFPVRIDEMTQLVAVEGQGDHMTYAYSVSRPLNELGGRDSAQQKLEQQWLTAACKSQDFQKLFRAGYTLQMRYSFQASPDEVLISIPPRTCGF